MWKCGNLPKSGAMLHVLGKANRVRKKDENKRRAGNTPRTPDLPDSPDYAISPDYAVICAIVSRLMLIFIRWRAFAM